MSSVNANINIVVNTSQATSQIRSLQAQVNSLNATLAQSGNASLIARQGQMNKALADAAVASGMFSAKSVAMSHSIDAFSKSLDRGQLTLGQYTRGVMSQMPGMRRVFQREFDTMTKVAESRVKRLQTQYTALGNAQKALALSPTSLAPGMATNTAMNIQKQMIFNKMVADGSTKLLNWGKNTQWAGRQLMVGFTLPLVAFGAAAAKTFMDLDKQARDFKRVYGDAFTPPSEIEANLKAVNKLGEEYTKYGIKLSDTMNIAATAAAAGMKNDQLISGTEETLRLATIGQVDYQQALATTISLQNAFKISNEELAPTVDFIGAVANQTVLTVDDMTKAIPKVAPVVAGLGGNIKDLAAMLVAMREGGISAEQGANALKSGLASLINPTKEAVKITDKFGINLSAIIQKNKGDLMGTVQSFGAALGSLDKFSRQQVLEKVFGKYQYARLGALFDNINQKAGQTKTALDLAGKSAQELGSLSAKSLREVEESTTAKFQGAIERLKIAIAPVGEAFLKALTPIINVVGKIADKFNELPDGVKEIITKIAAFGGIVAPVVLMLAGLFGNMIANTIKGIQNLRKFFAWIKRDASAFAYLSGEELDATAAARSLEGANNKLTESILIQQGAVRTLAGLYETLAKQMANAATAAALPGFKAVPAGKTGAAPRKYAKGVTRVPGSGNKDTVPALLTPGESVITKSATQKYSPIIAAMNAGTLQGFNGGVLHAAHISDPFPANDPRVQKILQSGADSAIGKKMLEALYPGSVTGTSQLTLGTAASTNIKLKEKTASFKDIKEINKDAMIPALAKQDPSILENKEAIKASRELTEAIKKRTIQIVKAEGRSKVSDADIAKATDQILKEEQKRLATLKKQGALDEKQLAQAKVLAAAQKAKSKLGEVRGGIGADEVAKGLKDGTLKRVGNSVVPNLDNKNVVSRLLAQGVSKEEIKKIRAAKPTNREFARYNEEEKVRPASPIKSGQSSSLGYPLLRPSGYITEKQQQTIAHNTGLRIPKELVKASSQAGAAVDKGFARGAGNASPSVKGEQQANYYKQGVLLGINKAIPEMFAGGERMGLALHEGLVSSTGNGAKVINTNGLAPGKISLPSSMLAGMGPTPGVAKSSAQVLSQGLKATLDAGKTISSAALLTKRESAPLWKTIRQSALDVARGTINQLKVAKQTQTASKRGIDNIASLRGRGLAGTPNLIQGVAPRSMDLIIRDWMTSISRVIKEEAVKQGPVMRQAFSDIWKEMKVNGKVAAKEISTIFKNSGISQSVKNLGLALRNAPDNIRIAVASGTKKITTALTNAGNSIATATQTAAGKIQSFFAAPSGKNGMTRGQRIGGAANNASMALMSVAMLGSFVEGPLQEFSQKLMMASMGLMVFQSLGTKTSLAIAPIALFTAMVVKSRMDIDNLAKEAAKAGQALGGIPDAMNIISEATGFKFPTQNDRLFRFDDKTQKAMGEFAGFFEGERGTAFVKELKEVSSEERYQKVALMLQQAINSGLDPEKAKAFGQAIAKATGDYIMNSRIVRDFASGNMTNRGGQGLIDMEKNRISKYQPQLSSEAYRKSAWSQGGINTAIGAGMVPAAIGGGAVGLSAGMTVGAAIGSAAAPVIGTIIGAAIGALIAGGVGWLATRAQQQKLDEVTGEAAKGLGFAMKTAENLANIEAVITDQRRKGIITHEQYAQQMADVDKMQEDQASYFRSLFAGGADNGALQQAMNEMLTLRNFSEDQRKIVTDKLNINTMAQDYFGVAFDQLNQAQKDYIGKVFEQVITGLTPENVEQRMQDLQGKWKDSAIEIMNLVKQGLDPAQAFSQLGVKEWAQQEFGTNNKPGKPTQEQVDAATQTRDAAMRKVQQARSKIEEFGGLKRVRELAALRGPQRTAASDLAQKYLDDVRNAAIEANKAQKIINDSSDKVAESIAKNFSKAEKSLDQLYNIGKEDVMAALSAFTDRKLAEGLASTKEGILTVGHAISAFKDYKNIKIEDVLGLKGNKNNNIDKIYNALNKMSKLKINKTGFGSNYQEIQRNAIAAQDYMNILIKTGDAANMSAKDMSDGYKGVIKNLDKAADQARKTKGAIEKNGNFKVTTQLLTTLFGGIISDPSQIATLLNSALPSQLDPMRAQILVSVMGNDAISNLFLANPKLLNALMTGKKTYTSTENYLGMSGVPYTVKHNVADTINSIPAFDAFGGYEGLSSLLGPAKDTGGGLDNGKNGGDSNGGGTPEKTWLEQKIEELMINKALYESGTKWAKETLKSRGLFFGALQQLRTGHRVNAKGKDRKGFLNAPEQMLEEIGAGPEGIKRVQELFKLSKEKFNELVRTWQNDILGSKINELRGTATKNNQAALVKKILGGDFTNVGKKTTKALAQEGMKGIIKDFEFTSDQIDQLMGDPEWVISFLEALTQGKDKVKELLKATRDSFKEAADDIETQIQKAEDAWSKYSGAMDAGFAVKAFEAEQKVGEDWFASQKDLVDQFNKGGDAAMNLGFYGDDQISNAQELEDALNRRIKLNEQMIQQQQELVDKKQEEINDYQRTNDLIQQGIDDLNRQNEIYNNRPTEALNHELEIMSQKENDIRKAYEDRVAALDKIASINQHILDQQKMQLGLADALSRGDIAAAAQAEQEMQASSAQYAVDQMRQGMQTGMENQVAGLITAGGLTREQAEKQLNQYKENSYQISLKIRAEEDKIYANNLLVRDLTNEIYNMNENIIEPLTNQNNTLNSILTNYQYEVDYAKQHQTFMEKTTIEWERQKNTHQAFMDQIESRTGVVEEYTKAWEKAAKAVSQVTGVPLPADSLPTSTILPAPITGSAAEARKAEAQAYLSSVGGGLFFSTGGMVPQYLAKGGLSRGTDTVPSMLTPGEFVMRKRAVDQYGAATFSRMNMGSFSMPRYSFAKNSELASSGSRSNTSASSPMYNTYSVNVNVPNTSADPDMIANKVMMKIAEVSRQNIRSTRGY